VQTTLLGLAIALILALVSALVGPLFVDWTRHRAALEAQASRLVGLPVRVGGQIDVRLLPTPSLLLGGIEIGAGTQRPLRATALGIELALGGLMRGQIRATELRLVGPDVTVGLDRDGRLSLPSLAAGFNLGDISIGRLAVEDARLTLAEAAGGRQAVLDKVWFGGEARSLGGVFRGEGAAVLNGELYGYRIATSKTDEGETRIRLSVEPAQAALVAESEGVLSFAQGAPRFEGTVTLARPLSTASPGGKVVLNDPWRASARVTATPASAAFEQIEMQYGPDERALKATGSAEMSFGARPQAQAVLSARQIDLDRLLATQERPRGDPVSAMTALHTALAGLSPPFPVRIGFGVDGVTLGGGVVQSLRGDVVMSADGVKVEGVELRAPGLTQVQLSGRIGAGSFSGPVDVRSADPRVFTAWLNGRSEAPAGAASPLRVRGEVVLDDTKLAVERLTVEVDRKPVDGRLAYVFGGEGRKARLEADLKAADADLDAMIALLAAASKEAGIERPGEMSLTLDMDRARFAGLDAQNAHVTAGIDASGIKIERLRIGDFGGMRIDAQGTIDVAAAAPRGAMTLDLDARDLSGLAALAAKFAPRSADVVRALSERAGKARLRAVLDADAASGTGDSVARLSLDGRVGDARLSLALGATGTLAEVAKAQIQLDGSVESDNAAALVRLAGLDRFIAADASAGRLTVAAKGPLGGDLQFDGRIFAAGLDAGAHGSVRLFADRPVTGAFDLAVAKADVSALLQRARPVPLALQARASLSGPLLKLDGLSAQVAGSALRGRLALTFDTVIGVEGDIDADAMDASALLAAAGGIAEGGSLTSEELFGRGLFAPLNGQVAFRLRHAAVGEALALTGARGILRLAPSELTVEMADAEFARGRLSGELSLRRMPDGTSAKTRFALKGADATLLAPGPSSPVSGRLALSGELEGTGRSPRALLGALSGAGTLTLAGARIAGLNPQAFAAAMRAVDQGLPLDGVRVHDIVAPTLDRGALSVRAAELPFTVSTGQARFGSLLVQAEDADAALSGAWDIAAQTVEMRAVLTGAAAEMPAGRPEIFLQWKGPLRAPARSIDAAALTGWLALRAVEQQSRRLDEIERPGGAPQAPTAVRVPPASAPPERPKAPPLPPRQRPAGTAAPSVAPLPPPVDIRPAPGLRPAQGDTRALPPATPRESRF
jgi:large subunit ribosomal protein L24